MNSSTPNLVEVDRVTVRNFGGSLYMLIPKAIREQESVGEGDVIGWYRSPDSSDSVVRKVPDRPAPVKNAV